MHCIQIMDNKSSSILLLVCYKISMHLHSAFNRVALMLLLINIDNAYYCISIAMCDVHTTAQFVCRIWNGPHTIVQMNWYLFGMSSVQQCDCFMIKENKMQITSVNIAHFVWYLEKLNSHRIFQPRSIMILSIFFLYFSLQFWTTWKYVWNCMQHASKTSFQLKWLQPTSVGSKSSFVFV